MKRFFLFTAAAVSLATPAHATGELICETASGPPTVISLGFGHSAVATGMWAHMKTDGNYEKRVVAQSWMDRERLLVDLSDDNRETLLARIDAVWNDKSISFDGTLTEGDRKRWIRCRG